MDVLELIREEHRESLERLKNLEFEKEGETREALFRQLYLEFKAHSEAEERVLFHPLKKAFGAEHGPFHAEFEDHRDALLVLREVTEVLHRVDHWSAKLALLGSAIQKHVYCVEGKLFEEVRAHFDEAERAVMAEQFRVTQKALADEWLELEPPPLRVQRTGSGRNSIELE